MDREILAARIRDLLPPGNIEEKRMFGGMVFMTNGNMLCCASRQGLMVRVGAAAEPEALAHPHARRCCGTGREMPGFVLVDPEGVGTGQDLAEWLAMAWRYVEALPPKAAQTGRRLPAASRGARSRRKTLG